MSWKAEDISFYKSRYTKAGPHRKGQFGDTSTLLGPVPHPNPLTLGTFCPEDYMGLDDFIKIKLQMS